MNELTIVIPALTTSSALIKGKLIKLATAFQAKLNVVIHADSPALKRSYFFGSDAIVDATQHFQKSVAQWCSEFELTLTDAGLEHHTEIVWGRHIAEYFESSGKGPETMLILVSSVAHTSEEYCDIIRHVQSPILILNSKPWGSVVSLIASVDPLHENDLPMASGTKLVEEARELSNALAGILMIVHSCFVPSYLLSSKKDIVLHHRANICDFMEEGGFGSLPYTMINGDPASSLREYVKDNNVDILAIGSVARGLFDRQVIGSTTESILSNTPSDLLLVRS